MRWQQHRRARFRFRDHIVATSRDPIPHRRGRSGVVIARPSGDMDLVQPIFVGVLAGDDAVHAAMPVRRNSRLDQDGADRRRRHCCRFLGVDLCRA